MNEIPLAPRRPAPRFGWPEVALAVGLAALVLLALSSVRVVMMRQELVERANALQAEIASLEDEHARLQVELGWSRSDAGVERLAREQLGWSKAGESAIVVAGRSTPRPTPLPSATPKPGGQSPLWGFIPIQ